MKISVKAIGTQLVIKKLADRVKKIDNMIDKSIIQSALIVEADAKKNSPVDTGRLRASITHQIIKKTLLKGTFAKVGTNVEYAPYVEFGTRKQKKQPYLYPALANNFNRIQGKLTAAVKGTIV